AQPIGEALARGREVLAGLAEDRTEAIRVVFDGVARVCARVDVVAPLWVLAPDDPVVFARANPLLELGDAPHGEAVRELELEEEAAHPVEARLPVLVLRRLAEKGIEVQLLRVPPAREHHQRTAGNERVAVHARRGAIAGELARAEPLEERRADGEERKPG